MGDFGPPSFMDKIGKYTIAPDNEDARCINKILEDRYGLDVNTNRPRFRLSWSTTQTEYRIGTYDVYYMRHIFLRTEHGKLEVPKYQHFQDKWVLEQLVYAPVQEIPETRNGHYEALYVFQDAKENYLKPLFRVCEIVIWQIRNPQRDLITILEERDKKLFAQEVAYFEDVLEDRSGSWIVSALHDREAVTVPRNYETQTYTNTGTTKGEI